MDQEKSFLGRGWAFPPAFDLTLKRNVMVSEEDDIHQSLFIILSTMPGEHVMDPTFGCDLMACVFDNVDSLALNRIKDAISMAILNFEPRITLDDIKIDTSTVTEGILNIHLEYIIRKINVRTNMVYPFYLKEGTNISGL